MSKTPKMDDYGGDSYGGRRRNKRRRDRSRSFRCAECEKLQYLSHNESLRAAAPRCKWCGGMLHELETSKKDRGIEQKPIKRKSSKRCPACGRQMINNFAMCQHFRVQPDCLRYVIDNRAHVHVSFPGACGHSCVAMSVYLEKNGTSSKPWRIYGILTNGQFKELGRFNRRYLATDFIYEHFGPVEAAR